MHMCLSSTRRNVCRHFMTVGVTHCSLALGVPCPNSLQNGSLRLQTSFDQLSGKNSNLRWEAKRLSRRLALDNTQMTVLGCIDPASELTACSHSLSHGRWCHQMDQQQLSYPPVVCLL
jgi:hypothetical protein